MNRNQPVEEKTDNVNHPNHYANQGSVECIDFIATVVNQYPGIIAGDLQNVTKYTWRSHGKNGKEDIAKAEWYFNHAEKTLLSLDKDARHMLEQTTHAMAKALLPKDKTLTDMADIQWKGKEEITKCMPDKEKALYQDVLHGINNFYSDGLREKAKVALKTWVKEYDHFQEKSKDREPTEKKGIHKKVSSKSLER